MKNLSISATCQIPVLQELYNKYLEIDTGEFVEVGAYDGESWSNTSCLADNGWRGLYIEPIAHHMSMCRKRHASNNVVFEETAIGNSTQNIEMSVVGGLSTTLERCHQAHKSFFSPDIFSYETKTIVRQNRLDTVMNQHSISQQFDLLVVDVEGAERTVFESFELAWWLPKMIIVELCDVHNGFNNYTDLQDDARWVRNHIILNGYVTVWSDSINTVFVR